MSRPAPPRLVLASASPARRATLLAAGIEPLVQIVDVDETAVLAAALAAEPNLSPAAQVTLLARAKAEAAAPSAPPDALVLGCDSMLELDGEVLGKPRDAADAARRIRQQSGRSAVLHTGHWLAGAAARDGRRVGEGSASSTVVRFAELEDAEITAYVASGEPLGVAGAFTIDGLGGPFVEGIVGDHHGVVGLSLPTLRHLLARFGVAVHELWRAVPL
ncbi:MAG: Maf family nucleotide pyrophosphatase [Bifidobacteriaceae bacterium]|jgi:septum formation protein|nr:Maf family nucleotide pyrophosphatase [Bifidobacteriaceae bacterium]